MVGLFAFFYDPKTKDKLPYYDKFPLVIPFGMYDNGFIGLNLHYATPAEREIILKFLMGIKHKKSKREYVKISYSVIKNAAQSKTFKPCIHRYLTSHIRSRLVKVRFEDWESVAALPFAKWVRK